jgi:hypothetical protein
MQILDDIWTSMKGHTKTRINDPIIGAFVLSWALCNWDKLVLLFFSTDKLESRVKSISRDINFLSEPSLILENNNVLLLPLILTFLYVFILPYVAHFVEKILKSTQIHRHDHTIDLDLNKAIKQKELNKARLRANPENDFLAQEVKIDIEIEKSEAEIKFAEAQAAKNQQIESKAKATTAEIELEKRQYQDEADKRTLAISTSKQKAILASHRLPSAYLFIELLSESVKFDGVVMPLSTLTQCIATTFGYSDFNTLLNDKSFANENLEKMKYVLIDTDRLTTEFTNLLDEADIDVEQFDSEWLIGHFEMIFEELPYELVYPESLANIIKGEFDEMGNGLLQDEGLSGGMADTNTSFDHVDEIILDDFDYDNIESTFVVHLSGSASGQHYKEHDISGQGVDIFIEAKCLPIIGKYGLLDYEYVARARPNYS